MKEIISGIKGVFSLIGGFLGYTLGGFDGFLHALLLFVVVDYLLGIMRAVLEKKLSSKVGFKGIFKKLVIFLLVAIAHIIDINIIKTNSMLRTAIIFFYISNEGISILENVAALGLPVPKKLRDVLKQIKEDKDERS